MSSEEEEEERSGPFEYSSLCYLIHHSLTPYTVTHQHKQNHKNLLIALSQVFTQIKLWTLHFHCHSHNEMVSRPAANTECSIGSEHHCLTKIVGDLIFFLGMESQYVQHLVENVLVAISEMVASSGSCWDKFIDSLCLYLELAINPLSPPLDPQTRAKHFECDSSRVIALKPTLKNVNWSLAAGIIQVLRNILKHIKREFDDQLFKLYLNSVGSCLSNVPWDWLNEIPVDPNRGSLSNSITDPLLVTDIGQRNSRVMFWGNLVQFFCSLVAQSGSVEATACLDKHPIVREINNIFPKVLTWCLGEQSDCSNMSTSQYFRHKNLMLMVNLSYHNHIDCSTLVSWLHLIHVYFQDLLSEPISQMEFGQNDCLEGSPFWASFPDVEKESMSRRHLQRLTVFLFLRCCFSLINLRERLDEHCICEAQDSCLIYEQCWGPTCCSRKKGLLEIYQWLQSHLPTDIFVNHQMYSETCTCFTLSFLQLYMHEDDILFKVLLQLFCVPSPSDQMVCKGKRTSQEVKDDMLSLVSNLFHPIRLFHLFLVELHYDHQVLLDYLISKDIGTSSAEYLLRCLRAVGDSWILFVEFSFSGDILNHSSWKKRKVLDGSDFQGNILPANMKGHKNPTSLEKEYKQQHIYGNKHNRTKRLPFEDAVECLLSLKKSVENLHQKNLFPYNPTVLLRRLTRFQELCFKQ